jgi:hypothetical protein
VAMGSSEMAFSKKVFKLLSSSVFYQLLSNVQHNAFFPNTSMLSTICP